MRRLLIFRHGIVINHWFLEPMARFFRRRGYDVRNRSYPSTRKTVQEHALDLAEEIRAAVDGGEADVYFVTHSMGALILRYALTHHELPPAAKLQRAVLLGPPNQGSAKARHYRNDPFYELIYGTRAGKQLCDDPPGIFGDCGIPDNLQIGIVGGNRNPPQLLPIPLEKPNDGIVTLAETRLGEFPVCALPVSHTGMLFRPLVWRVVSGFLETGRFCEPCQEA